MATLVNFNSEENHVSKMKDGDIGIIISWEVEPEEQKEYIGIVVQRFEDNLIVIGGRSGLGWKNIFKKDIIGDLSMNCQVKLLQTGDTIII